MTKTSQNQRTRFIESLDTVRDAEVKVLDDLIGKTEPDSSRRFRQLQARLEIEVSLLMGEPILLSEPASFDSFHNLSVIAQVVRGRDALRNKTRSDLAKVIDTCPVWRPFGLLFESDTRATDYIAMVAAKFADLSFVQSAMHVENRCRIEAAAALHKRDFKAAKLVLHRSSYQEHVELIRQLEPYFDEVPIPSVPKSKLPILAAYMKGFKEFIEAELPVTDPLRDAIRQLDALGTDYRKRSEAVRNLAQLVNQHALPYDTAECVVEALDDLYNRAIAESLGAESQLYSMRGRNANYLTRRSNRLTRKFAENYTQRTEGGMYLYVDAERVSDALLNKLDRTARWESIWEVIATDEWLQSVNNLHAALEASTHTTIKEPQKNSPRFHERARANDALESHINVVSSLLGSELLKLESKNGILEGGVFDDGVRIISYFMGIPSASGMLKKRIEKVLSTKPRRMIKQALETSISIRDEFEVQDRKDVKPTLDSPTKDGDWDTQGSVRHSG